MTVDVGTGKKMKVLDDLLLVDTPWVSELQLMG